MTQYAFHFNSDVCTGCKTCQVACKETYKLPVNNLYRKVPGRLLEAYRGWPLRA